MTLVSPDRFNRSDRPIYFLIALIVFALLLGGCDKKPKSQTEPLGRLPTTIESGWVPFAGEPIWSQYQVRGDFAIVQGDIVFDLPWLRSFQAEHAALVRPILVESYTGPNGTAGLDQYYSGDGNPEVASTPGSLEILSGGLGVLTDGHPDNSTVVDSDGWVSWMYVNPELTFELGAPAEVDAIDLTIDVNWIAGLEDVEVQIGDTHFVRHVGLDFYSDGGGVRTVRIAAADGSGLGLVGDSVTLRFPGSTGLYLAEVSFLSGDVAQETGTTQQKSNIITGDGWPSSVIPYQVMVPDGWTTTQRSRLDSALQEWEDESDYTFVESSTAMPRVQIFNTSGESKPDCYTNGAGPPVSGENGIREMHIVPDCNYSNVLHEIGHVIGLRHEQQRSDVMRYVDVLWDNVQPGRLIAAQFRTKGKPFGSYDYMSIMHYPETAFGKEYCCIDWNTDMSQEGAPDGCSLFDDVAIDVDGDDEPDECPSLLAGDAMDIPFKKTSHTLAIKRDVPTQIEQFFGEWTFLSKTDVAAANALLSGEVMGGSYNALSSLELQGFAPGASMFEVAYVNEDAYPDIVAFHTQFSPNPGHVEVALGQPDGSLVDDGGWGYCPFGQCALGDIDNDGLDDLVMPQADGSVMVAASSGTQFVSVIDDEPWHDTLGNAGKLYLADLDGDCRDDLIQVTFESVYIGGTTTVKVALSEEGRFAPVAETWFTAGPTDLLRFGDVDKDGKADLVVDHRYGLAGIQVYISEGDGFAAPEMWSPEKCDQTCLVEDIDSDGRADLVRIDRLASHHTDRINFEISNGLEFVYTPIYHELDCRSGSACLVVDLDGDGVAEVVDPATSIVSNPLLRAQGDVYVSRVDRLWMASIGARYGGGGGIYNPGNSCIDPELEF